LRAIEKPLAKHGVTSARLRADFAGTEIYRITTFRELHGDLGAMPEEVEQDAQQVYLYGKPGTREPIWSLLEAFVNDNHVACLAEIARVAGE
jgi:hypothetical protein